MQAHIGSRTRLEPDQCDRLILVKVAHAPICSLTNELVERCPAVGATPLGVNDPRITARIVSAKMRAPSPSG